MKSYWCSSAEYEDRYEYLQILRDSNEFPTDEVIELYAGPENLLGPAIMYEFEEEE